MLIEKRNKIINSLKKGKVQVLDLSKEVLDADDLRLIAQSLPNNPRLVRIILDSSKLCTRINPRTGEETHTIDGILALSLYLRTTEVLNSLQIDHCQIIPYAWGLLASSLSINKSLRVLSLQGTLKSIESQETVIQSLCQVLSHNESIHTLNLDNNNLGDAHIYNIFNALEGVRFVSLKSNNISALCIHTFLHEGSFIFEEFCLDDNPLGDHGAIVLAKLLAKIAFAKIISLENCNISNLGFEALCRALQKNVHLQKLYLDNNKISSVNFSNAKIQNTTLQILSLSNNLLDNAASQNVFAFFLPNFLLSKIDVSHNKITDAACNYIIYLLKANDKILEINFANNNLSYRNQMNFTKLIATHPSLQNLSFTNREITKFLAEKLAKLDVESNPDLSMSDNSSISSDEENFYATNALDSDINSEAFGDDNLLPTMNLQEADLSTLYTDDANSKKRKYAQALLMC